MTFIKKQIIIMYGDVFTFLHTLKRFQRTRKFYILTRCICMTYVSLIIGRIKIILAVLGYTH